MTKQQKFLVAGAVLCVAGYFYFSAKRKAEEAPKSQSFLGKAGDTVTDVVTSDWYLYTNPITAPYKILKDLF